MKTNRSLRQLLTSILVLSLVTNAYAATSDDSGEPENGITKYYKKVLEQFDVNPDITAETTDLLGEQIDLSSGALSFSNRDISIPGNFDIPVEVLRTFSDSNIDSLKRGGFGDWNLEIPSMHTTSLSGQRILSVGGSPWNRGAECTSSQVPDPMYGSKFSDIQASSYWNGVDLQISGTSQKLLYVGTPAQTYSTKNRHKIQCFRVSDGAIVSGNQPTGTREGFRVTDTNGVVYYFDQFHSVKRLAGQDSFPIYDLYLFASKVIDRFGNRVDYTYETITGPNNNQMQRLKSISASDGRVINFYYEGPAAHLISSIEAGSKVWRYTYKQVGLYYTLENVHLPEPGLRWTYDLTQLNFLDNLGAADALKEAQSAGNCNAMPATRWTQIGSITHPMGTKGTFELQTVGHGRTNVPYAVDNSGSDTTCYLTQSLKTKTLTGPGLAQMRWNYRYSQNAGSYSNTNTALAPVELNGVNVGTYNKLDLKVTSVEAPDGSVTKNVFSRKFVDYLENIQLATLQYDVDGQTLLQKVVKEFKKSPSYFGGAIYSDSRTNIASILNSSLAAKDTIEVYARSGLIDTYNTEYGAYNEFDALLDKKEWNSFRTNSYLYTRLAYQNFPDLNIFNLPSVTQVSNDNVNYITISSTEYIASNAAGKALPYKNYAFGRLIQTNSYNENGTLMQSEYGPGLWVKFDRYKRGHPELIKLPKRYTIGEMQVTSTVNYDGTIESTTDLNGNLTTYKYDAVKRLVLIDPFDARWENTTIQYTADPSLRGSLIQTLVRGSSRKSITLDALMRPILQKEWDVNKELSTVSYVNRQFNAYGKDVFTSVASFDANERYGKSTTYDGLQRLVTQTNTANGDVTYGYEIGNAIRLQNGRGFSSLTSFLAYGQPKTETPLTITQADGGTTSLEYNAANRVIRIEQGGYAEIRKYNQNMEVCLQKRPETGVKVYSYNDLGQVKTYAEGLSGNGSSCTDYTPDTTAVVTLDYDNLGDVKAENFADGTPAKTTVLDAQGNLKQLNSGAVTWDYTYNSANLVESETLSLDQKSFPLGYTYNAMGHMTQRRYPAGLSINYGVNALGEIESVSQDSTMLASNVKYHPDGQIAEFVYGNGLKFKQTLDGKMRPFERQVFTAFTPAVSHSYQYDAVNNIEVINDAIEPVKSLTMTYDGLDRIKTSSSGNFGSIAFNYDTLGNIVQKQIFTTVHNYSYDNFTKRLSSAQGMSFSYDTRGNVLNNGRRDFVYNRSNQLVSSGALQYVYDGHGRRVKQLKNSQNTYSVYDMQGSLVYRGNPDTTATASVYLGAQLIAELDSGGPAPLPAKPTITLNLTSTLVVGSCNIFGQKCTNSRNVIYGWSSSNASSCQGQLNQTTTTGSLISSLALSGTSLPSTMKSYPATDALYTLTLTCTGPGGSTTQTKSVAGVGSTVPGEEM